MMEQSPRHPRFAIIRLAGERLSFRCERRTLGVLLVLVALAALAAFVDLSLGNYRTTLLTVIDTLSGRGDANSRLVVLEWRLPRVLAALLFGAALGASGAIFQSLARNPLGSPDIVGVDAGAFTGALLVMAWYGGASTQVFAGAFSGGILTACVVLALARGRTGIRFILVGVGIGMALTAINTWLLSTLRLEVALSAAHWGAGSLDKTEMDRLLPVAFVISGLLAAAFLFQRPLRAIELGDDVARVLGLPVGGLKVLMALTGGAITVMVTASVGPVGFVALASPQIARILCGSPGLFLPAAAAMGAVLLTVADVVAANIVPNAHLPVGIVTLCGGGAYLLMLLASRARNAGGPDI